MRAARLLAIAATLFVVSAPSFADETSCKPLRIEIEGLRRTKPRVVERAIGLKSGDCSPSEISTDDISNKLLDMKLFGEASATVDDSGDSVVVKIKVKERFTPVPVPIFFATKEDLGGGVFLFDPNFFGLAKVLIAGAVISQRGQRYQAMYMDDHVAGSRYALFLRSVYGDNVLKKFSGDKEVYAFEQIFSQLIVAGGYHLTERFMPTVGLLYRRQGTQSVKNYAEPPDDLFSPAVVIDLRYKATRHESFYERGSTASLSFDQALPMLGSDRVFGHTIANVEYTTPLARSFLFRAEGECGFGYGDLDILTSFRLGGEPGSRGLPNRGIWVQDYGSASVALEEPIYKHKWGTLTTTQFADALVTGEDDPVRTYPGLGVGIRVYIKELAIPAVGFDGAYSTWTQGFHLSAYIGKTF